MNALLDGARRLAYRAAGRARRRLSGSDGGFVLLESIIAISLITVIMAAIGAEYVASVASIARQRSTQSAAEVANSTLEQVRALRPSDLVTGRDSTSVATQFSKGNAIPSVSPLLQQMDQASDASAAVGAGANATIPTCDPAPQGAAGPALCTQKPGTVAYTVSQFIGTCWLVNSGTSSNCVPAAQKAASSVGYLRVVVSVSWRDGSCNAGCYYVTSTLVNASADPTFKANQPPAPAPAITPPGDQNDDIGDAVNLQLGLVTGSGVPGFTWTITSGTLPAGLSLSPAGVISGVVSGPAGIRSLTAQVTDGYGRTDTTTFNWTVGTPPAVTAPANQVSGINSSVSLQLTTSCTNTPCTYTLNNPPAGLSVNNTGLISGTPTVAGTSTMSVTIIDAASRTVTSNTFTWTVLPAASSCPTAVTLPNGSFETPGVWPGAGSNVGNGTSGMVWRTNDPNNQIEYWANGGSSTSNNGNTPITAEDGTQWVEVNGAGMDTLYQDLPTTPGQVLQWSLWHRARNTTGNVNAQDSIQVQLGSTTQQAAQVPSGATSPTISDGASAWVRYTGTYTVPAGQTTTRFQVAATATSTGSLSAGNFLDAVSVTGVPCMSPQAAQFSTVNNAINPVQLSANQGSGNYTWSGGSSLPAGLTMSASGLITGTPTSAGSTRVQLILTDQLSGYQQAVAFTWTVYAAPIVSAPPNQTTSVGAAVNVPVASSCPNAACTYTLNNPPAGLSVNTMNGTISGTPTAAGTTTSTLTITDAAGASSTSGTFTWTVKPAPAITSPGNQSTTVGATVSLTPASTCGYPTCTYTAGALPAGLTLNASTGAVTGNPTTTGSTTSSVTIRDAAGTTATTGSFTWTVYPAPSITALANQTTSVGGTVSITVGSNCQNTPCTYTLNNPPAGLSTTGATVTGSPTATGTTTSTVTVRDAAGITATTPAFTWTVKAAPTVSAPANQTTSVGGTVSLAVTTTCANSPCTYVLNNAPGGLSMTGATITGSPTTAGTTTSTVTVRDAAGSTVTSGPFTWTVKAGPTITAPNQSTTVGVSVNFTPSSTCANTSCSYSASNLPTGLSINATTGTITGNPSTAGTSNPTVTVIDAAGSTSSITFTWTIYARPTVTTPGTQTTTVGASVNVGIGSTCANTPCTYTLSGQPAGLTINSATGAITGTPTATGTSNLVTVTITDAAGVTATTGSFTWTVKAAPTITTPANQTTDVGVAVNLPTTSTCANTPCTYTINGQPAGLTINSATGAITGTPTATGTSNSVRVTITDAAGVTAATGSFTWTVKAAPTITTPANQTTDVGVAVNLATTSTCANTPCTYTINGQPAGLTINSATGAITGTPTTPGTSSVTVTITDAAGATATATFTWTIYARPTITSPGNQTDTVNTALILPISSTCANTPCTYTLSGQPAGLSINSATGSITGTPTATGTSSAVKVTVTDAGGVAVSTPTFSSTITAAPSVTSPGNQSTANNAAVNLTLTKSCPNSPCAYALKGGPTGLSISSAGVVSGTVTSAPRAFSGVTITVTDSSGVTATSASFTWTVTAPLVGRWTFDEASGSNVADSAGSHPATLTGGYGRTGTAVLGANAVTLNGSNASATTTGPILNTASSFTVSAWVKINSLSGYQTFVSQDGSNVSAFYLQYRGDTGKFAFTRQASDSTGASGTIAGATAAPVAGQWYQLTGVYDSVARTISLYVNGVRQGSPVSYTTGWNATGTFVMGRGKYNGATDWVNGAIDDVRAYSSALSDEAVTQLAQAAYLRLDEGTGTTARDSSLNGADATLTGGTSWTTGIVGPSAVQFNGSNGAGTISPSPIDTSQSFTVSAWAKADTTTSTGAVLSADGTNISSFLLRQNGDKWAMLGVLNDSGNASVTTVTATSSLVVGQWYQLVGVYDSVARTIALYVNGVLQGSPASVSGNFAAGGPFVIGRSYYQGNTNYFAGAIDDVHAFQFAIDQTGVNALSALTPPTPAAPTATAGSTSAAVSWTAPVNVGGSPVTGYVVTPYLNGVAQTPVSYSSTATSQTLTGLSTGGSYSFSVAAVNTNGTSATSAMSSSVLVS